MEETFENENKPWLFKEGNPGGPGRPTDTPEKKIEKKVIKELVEEYKQALADALPEIHPILKAKALDGDVPAIKEIHDRVMGKAQQSVDVTTAGKSLFAGLTDEEKAMLDKLSNAQSPSIG